MTKTAAKVEFINVSKRYGAVTAVDDVSFTIEPGTLVTLLGPSGCGKTTTLRLIAGLEQASSGRIMIGEDDVTLRSATDRDVSMVFQSYALFPHMSVLENVSYGPKVQGAKRADAEAMALEKLALVGLAGYEKRQPSELSGGQQQRVAVARALVLEPKVLLFDEPLSNLDAKLRRRVREEIRELQQNLNLTVAYVTHDQEEALAVSDRIIVMSNSRIAQVGAPTELYEEPANLFVADFIGDANIVEGDALSIDNGIATVKLGPITRVLPARGMKAGRVKVAIRPNALSVVAADAPMEGGDALPGRIAKSAYLGKHLEYDIETEIGTLFLTDPVGDRPLAKGTDVRVLLGARGVTVVGQG